MQLAFTPEQDALRRELRDYFTAMMTPEVEAEMARHEMGGPLSRELARKMGADGWLGVGWPKEYGGQDRSPLEQLVFFDEASRAGAPVPLLTINSVGPTLMRYGSDDQKHELLPQILGGEIQFAIGYSEPGAGTDLASLKTRAVRDGDEYVIDGQKIFTSLADLSDYVWLAVRTNPDAPKHKGISILIVPTSAPGFSLSPIRIVGGGRTNMTFYDNVRVPVTARVGDENEGWKLITTQLNHERVALCNSGMLSRNLNDVRVWAARTRRADGTRVIDQEWVQVNLARVAARVEFLKLMNWKVAWGLTTGSLAPTDASVTKIFGTELNLEVYRLLMEVIGPAAYLKRDTPGAVLRGRLERAYAGNLILTFGGGTNEIQRDIVSMVGLGMPRAPR
ncbi:MAG TPA: acyl-CoA dehydrogenase family protein [Acidimicrobiia bacterium]|nr:acyl-CoA dehydrogenase family protein [Acidimicrobiia bacterium]